MSSANSLASHCSLDSSCTKARNVLSWPSRCLSTTAAITAGCERRMVSTRLFETNVRPSCRKWPWWSITCSRVVSSLKPMNPLKIQPSRHLALPLLAQYGLRTKIFPSLPSGHTLPDWRSTINISIEGNGVTEVETSSSWLNTSIAANPLASTKSMFLLIISLRKFYTVVHTEDKATIAYAKSLLKCFDHVFMKWLLSV